MDDIHSRIKRLRTDQKLSMEALAAKVGVKWQTVQQWEKHGGTAPKRERLASVAEALGTTQTYLMVGNLSPAAAPLLQQEITTYPFERNNSSLIKRLSELAHQIDETGLRGLIDVAECFTKSHPAQKAKAS
jgi:transcriptional regulator with XRE-family HTH domain